jgi:hypothetical protein
MPDDRSVQVAFLGRRQLREVTLDAGRELVAVGISLGLDHSEMAMAARPWSRAHTQPGETRPAGEPRPFRGHENNHGEGEKRDPEPPHGQDSTPAQNGRIGTSQ